jgi:hypothetical protein
MGDEAEYLELGREGALRFSLPWWTRTSQLRCSRSASYGRWRGHCSKALFETLSHEHLVGKIDLSGCAVDGFGERASSGIWDATEGAHMPIVPHGCVEERVVPHRCEVEPPVKGIRARGRVMQTATGYKCSVAFARHGALQ